MAPAGEIDTAGREKNDQNLREGPLGVSKTVRAKGLQKKAIAGSKSVHLVPHPVLDLTLQTMNELLSRMNHGIRIARSRIERDQERLELLVSQSDSEALHEDTVLAVRQALALRDVHRAEVVLLSKQIGEGYPQGNGQPVKRGDGR
jgi:hypothetical protein